MFSFIKWFGTVIENAKKNKGLWFTLLTTFSLIGIFVSLYFVNFLVSDVAQKTYENQKKQYVVAFKNKLHTQNQYTEAAALVLSRNQDIANEFFATDINASKRIDKKANDIAQKLNTSLGKKSVTLTFEEGKKQKKELGLDVEPTGTFFVSAIPMVDKNGTIISAKLRKDIDTLVDVYQKEQKEFAFFLNESAIHKIDAEYKRDNYTIYHDIFFIQANKYKTSFLDELKKVDFSGKLEESGYVKDNRYFYVYQKVYDIDGDYIGLAFIAEQVKDENSFVNLVKNLVNSVTMVALGLIVSMLLFLF